MEEVKLSEALKEGHRKNRVTDQLGHESNNIYEVNGNIAVCVRVST